ncbi:MAG: PadR family transcriptional regulator [Solirubrobacteraceae bacterium]|nr:PadR family transcriptional regulator [Solirubrobacteraceae bacterium]
MPPRFFKHGELPLVLLALLSETPRHGYEIMAELTRLFPKYRASPGSIYPAIEALQTEGLLEGRPVAGKIVYRTTSLGDQALQDRGDTLASLELRHHVTFGGESLDALLTRFKARLLPLSGHVDDAEVSAVLNRAALEIELLNALARPTKQRKHHAR